MFALINRMIVNHHFRAADRQLTRAVQDLTPAAIEGADFNTMQDRFRTRLARGPESSARSAVRHLEHATARSVGRGGTPERRAMATVALSNGYDGWSELYDAKQKGPLERPLDIDGTIAALNVASMASRAGATGRSGPDGLLGFTPPIEQAIPVPPPLSISDEPRP